MTIDTFTKSEFEDALPTHRETGEPLWVCLGLLQSEYTYRVAGPDRTTSIEVRSSIGPDGMSAPSGKDSLRAWLVDASTGKPLGSKVTRWTTRLPGWQERLRETLRTLWLWRLRAGDCPKCDKPKGIWKVKKEGANKGRPFAKCSHCGLESQFVWLDEKSKIPPWFASKAENDWKDANATGDTLATLKDASNSIQEDTQTSKGLNFLSDDDAQILGDLAEMEEAETAIDETVDPSDIEAGDMMLFVVKAMVVRPGVYRLYRCAYPPVLIIGDDSKIPQGSRITNEREVCQALFPSLAMVAEPDAT